MCSRNWYGENCTTFCNKSETTTKCNENGERVCSHNWYGENCIKFCDNNSASFKCNDHGEKVCLPNKYGVDCATFCYSSAINYRCNDQGKMVCLRHWHGENCSTFCNISETAYKCNTDGTRKCSEYRYGDKCELNCRKIETSSDLYVCEVGQGSKASCPKQWKNRTCSSSCIKGEGNELEYVLRRCNTDQQNVMLCSETTQDDEECDAISRGITVDLINVLLRDKVDFCQVMSIRKV